MSHSAKDLKNVAEYAKGINESFLANINHALRTPLNGLVGMSDLLAKSGLDSTQLRYAHVIRESTENLMLQLDNILELSNVNENASAIYESPNNLRDIVQEALKPLLPAAVKYEIPISLEYALDLPDTLLFDAQKLKLVLRNLVSCSLKFADRGKVVLKISGQPDENNSEIFKFRFELSNSKILYDMLHNTMEEYNSYSMADLRDFGEITVSLITVQRLLEAMNSGVSFDNMNGNEPPFHFDLNLKTCADAAEISAYTVLRGKRALILQPDILQQNMITQSLRLWGIDYRILSNQDDIDQAIIEAHREGRGYNILFSNAVLEESHIARIKEKVPNIILTAENNDLQNSDVKSYAAHLCPPVFPEELQGTLASLYLNQDDQQEISIAQESSQHITHAHYKPIKARVFLVEDDFVSRMYATELLSSFGCDVTVAEDGVMALTKFLDHSDYDLIFMDCMMPRLDGYNATRKIREAGHELPIIALTANTMEQDRDKCLTAGMSDYITKPVKEQDLYAALTKHLKK